MLTSSVPDLPPPISGPPATYRRTEAPTTVPLPDRSPVSNLGYTNGQNSVRYYLRKKRTVGGTYQGVFTFIKTDAIPSSVTDRVGPGGDRRLVRPAERLARDRTSWDTRRPAPAPGRFAHGRSTCLDPRRPFRFRCQPGRAGNTHAFVWTNQVSSPVPVVRTTTSCDCLNPRGATAARTERGLCFDRVCCANRARPAFYAAFLEVAEPAQLLMFTVSGTVQGAGNAALSDAASEAVLIGVEELRRRLAASEPPTLVDVRSQGAFVLGHIAGSLNLRLGDLRGRAFLRQVSVVLVSEGHNSQELAAETTGYRNKARGKCRFSRGGCGRGKPQEENWKDSARPRPGFRVERKRDATNPGRSAVGVDL